MTKEDPWKFVDSAPRTRDCVFCGRPDTKTNKEHILPRWLMKMGGDDSRIVYMGKQYFNENETPTTKDLFLPFKAMTTPACIQCNTNYANTLEKSAKIVVDKLLKFKPVSRLELSDLMDWMDKIRIGLLYLKLNMSRNPLGIKPAYRVDRKTGSMDHILWITRHANNRGKRVSFGYGDDLNFMRMPCSLVLNINQITITSLSTTSCFSPLIHKEYHDVKPSPVVGLMDFVHKKSNPYQKRKMWPLWSDDAAIVGRCVDLTKLALPASKTIRYFPSHRTSQGQEWVREEPPEPVITGYSKKLDETIYEWDGKRFIEIQNFDSSKIKIFDLAAENDLHSKILHTRIELWTLRFWRARSHSKNAYTRKHMNADIRRESKLLQELEQLTLEEYMNKRRMRQEHLISNNNQ